MYDSTNVFARILKGEIPCKKITEGEHYFSFHDIAPRTPVHALCIPKGPYATFVDLITLGSAEEVWGFHKGIYETITLLGLDEYRLNSNNGKKSGQEVFHYHVHILGGFK